MPDSGCVKEFLFVRHAESEYNAYLTDNLDSCLTPQGEEQALATGKFLAGFPEISQFTGLVSPYLRALQTAKIISQETGVRFRVVESPREIMVKYDTVFIPIRREEFPEFDWGDQVEAWRFDRETTGDFLTRINGFRHTLDGRVLVVSHGTPVNAMYELTMTGESRASTVEYVRNASVSYVRNGEGVWFGILPNEIPD